MEACFCSARTPWALRPRELAFGWGGFGEAYCVGFFHDLVTPLGKPYLNHLGDLLKSRPSFPFSVAVSEWGCVCVGVGDAMNELF